MKIIPNKISKLFKPLQKQSSLQTTTKSIAIKSCIIHKIAKMAKDFNS